MIKTLIDEMKTGKIGLNNGRGCCQLPESYIKGVEDEFKNFPVYEELEPTSVPAPKIFTVASYYGDRSVNRPTDIKKIGNEWYVLSYYKNISVFDENFTLLRHIGNYGTPETTNDNFSVTRGFDINETAGLLAVACTSSHVVRVYSFPDMVHQFDIGSPGVSGNIANGYLNQPYDVVITDSNIYVASYYGETSNLGAVFEFDLSGNYVETKLEYDHTGYTWDMEVYHPRRIQVFDGDFYVSNGRDDIGVYDASWNYVTTYTKPSVSTVGSIYPQGVYKDTDKLWVLGNSFAQIIELDVNTHDVLNTYGSISWADRADMTPKPNTMYNPYAFSLYEAGVFIVCDHGNNRLCLVYQQETEEVEYPVPANINVLYSSKPIVNSNKVLYPVGVAPEPLYLVYTKND